MNCPSKMMSQDCVLLTKFIIRISARHFKERNKKKKKTKAEGFIEWGEGGGGGRLDKGDKWGET